VTGPGDTEGAPGLPRTGAGARQRRDLQARPEDEGADSSSGSWPRPGVSPLRPPEDSFPEPADYDPPQYDQQYGSYEQQQPYEQQPSYDQQQYEPYEQPYERTGTYQRPNAPGGPPQQGAQNGPPAAAPYQPEQFDTEHYDEEDLPRVRSGRRASPVRPYVRTGGRTRSNRELALETLVSVSQTRPRSARPPNREYRRVVDLCGVPRSIAEVAALTSVPVGVARVLVGDLAAQGLLTVHQTRGPSGAATDMALMQRVLAGLRKL
jgi:uncharacterized protein DUF742